MYRCTAFSLTYLFTYTCESHEVFKFSRVWEWENHKYRNWNGIMVQIERYNMIYLESIPRIVCKQRPTVLFFWSKRYRLNFQLSPSLLQRICAFWRGWGLNKGDLWEKYRSVQECQIFFLSYQKMPIWHSTSRIIDLFFTIAPHIKDIDCAASQWVLCCIYRTYNARMIRITCYRHWPEAVGGDMCLGEGICVSSQIWNIKYYVSFKFPQQLRLTWRIFHSQNPCVL